MLLEGTGVSEVSEMKGQNILPGGSAPRRSMQMSRLLVNRRGKWKQKK